jgi:hypothetical protein
LKAGVRGATHPSLLVNLLQDTIVLFCPFIGQRASTGSQTLAPGLPIGQHHFNDHFDGLTGWNSRVIGQFNRLTVYYTMQDFARYVFQPW